MKKYRVSWTVTEEHSAVIELEDHLRADFEEDPDDWLTDVEGCNTYQGCTERKVTEKKELTEDRPWYERKEGQAAFEKLSAEIETNLWAYAGEANDELSAGASELDVDNIGVALRSIQASVERALKEHERLSKFAEEDE
jgi:hypothetical protein